MFKVLAGRPKDLEDVQALLERTDIDRGEVRSLLGQLEEALAQSDLLPAFEAACRRADS